MLLWRKPPRALFPIGGEMRQPSIDADSQITIIHTTMFKEQVLKEVMP